MLFPRVKVYREENDYLKLDKINICFADGTSETLINAARFLLPFEFYITDNNKANIILKNDFTLSNKESYYKIEVLEDKIIAKFTDREAGRDAISVIAELLNRDNDVISIKKVYIEDWADLKFRSFMLDVGRKYVPINEIKSQILLMAKMRMNVFHFHFTEYTGFGIALNEFPELKGASITGCKQYTEQEIVELVDFADSLCIDIIPEVDLPAHANAITSEFPELLCKTTDSVPPNGWALCVGNEATYSFLEKLITSVCKLFKSKYFHLGTDEVSMYDCDRIPKPVADFSRCSICSSLNLNDIELLYYFIKRVHEILSKLGKTMIIWNDQVDISKSPDIPRDIIVEFWRVAGPHRGPIEGCSMQRFLEEGFDVINANYPDTYIDLYVDYERLKNWNPRLFPANDNNTKGKIIGADFCAWDIFKHYVQSIPISTALFADKFRNTNFEGYTSELLESISNRLLGIKNFNIFNYTNKIINLDESLDIFKCDVKLELVKEALNSHTPRDISEEFLKSVFLSLI